MQRAGAAFLKKTALAKFALKTGSMDAKCNLAVDLTPMIPGGANGGVKPAVLTFLRVLVDEHGETFRFLFLTNSSTHNDLLWLVRPEDLMLCILELHRGEIDQVKIPAPNFRIVKEFRPYLLRKLGVDVFYCPFGATDRSIPEIPTISMVVDLLHRDYPFSIPDGERAWREEYFQQLLLDADYIQGISNYTVSRLLHHYPLSSERVFFTYLPIDQRLRYGSRPVERPFFFYPANFWVHKNHEILLIAYGLYRETSFEDGWDLVFTGHLDERAEQLKSLADTLGIGRYVHFRGHLNEEEFADLFDRAGALVYPSLHEGFGIPLVEAMRFRKPIICSRYASIPEIAGSAALYINAKDPVELASSMKRISEDHELRARLVDSGEHRLREFSISKEVQKLAEILLIAKKHNNKLAVFRRYVTRYAREQRRLTAAQRRRIRAGGPIGNILQKAKDRLYLLKLRILHLKRD
jgi:glycosyltransferase involved in cell wall biosynthesis